MAGALTGKTIAILAADGVEQAELVEPRRAVQDAGGTTELLSLESGTIQAVNSDINLADTFKVDKVVGKASPGDYDALLLPAGRRTPTTCAWIPAPSASSGSS